MDEGADSRKRTLEQVEDVSLKTLLSAAGPAKELKVLQTNSEDAVPVVSSSSACLKEQVCWKDYLIGENIVSPGLLERGARPFSYTSSRLRVVRRDLQKQLPGYAIYIVEGFVLADAIRTSPKKQPDQSKQPGYEELNKPTLEVIEGDNIIIMDDSGIRSNGTVEIQEKSYSLKWEKLAIHL
ncbi:hypothetical protein HOY80DRAFT_1003891 [Tuber brumale]|nr:hypothetical protein HOY80DRAFT_1003891 [Tuber brumale]